LKQKFLGSTCDPSISFRRLILGREIDSDYKPIRVKCSCLLKSQSFG